MPASSPLRNPGCPFCIYHLPYSESRKEPVRFFCIKSARVSSSPDKKKWRWIGCENATIKNKGGYCREFSKFSLFMLKKYRVRRKFGADYRMERPVLAGDKFWQT